MPPVASRRGRQISSKACDSCRDRKIQCGFDGDSTTCRRCSDSNLACTFLRERKPRGPPARRLARDPTALTLPVGELCIELLCSRNIFLNILDDYLEMVYPLLPLIHRPQFRARLEIDTYTKDSGFFRLCIALCAVTVASLPRKFDSYSAKLYPDVGAMVDRACHLVLLSRLTKIPDWQNRPSMDSMLVSILLTMASHYAGRSNQGWAYASEAIQFFRALELYRKEAYGELTALERELCKRAFWMLYIIQIHDRLSFIVPHTGLSFDPLHTDWEYLLPLVLEDEDLDKEIQASTPHNPGLSICDTEEATPLIAGFVALIKVFLCVVDLLSHGFPGSPPQAYAMTSGSSQTQAEGNARRSTVSLGSLLRIIKQLQGTLEELPNELKISTLDPQLRTPEAEGVAGSPRIYQFDIMRANIHITSLYIQSTILETCSNAFTTSNADQFAASPSDDRSSPGYAPRTQLWKFRESIAKELLEVLNFCSSRTLEANGTSMIVKIREIAATLLGDGNDIGVTSDLEEQSRQYVQAFAEILASIDHLGHSTIIPPIFSAH
ncbi:hypothetical protein P154DRAFT_492723 [Amniculicola lignicola CBS 123094]|uniref:Zn(2)-C6 fungal-type domain-containing protein n=1 Tax=Amniculicola lignicola CBS 123094 TaxID=1392246 RepID=A0A6A5WE08_9PLEO|nr:hypothetical protein P154DRAFT_492723 [Amniculicola lignicola CBS 123094]